MTPRNEHEEIAARLVALALESSATGGEASVSAGNEFEAQVRLGEIETLKEAGSRAAGLRVLLGQRAGSAYSSDLSEEGLRRMVQSAVELARIATEDPFAGLPDPGQLGALTTDLQLFSESVERLEPAFQIEQARLCEQAALQTDPRIDNTEGASFSSYTGWPAT